MRSLVNFLLLKAILFGIIFFIAIIAIKEPVSAQAYRGLIIDTYKFEVNKAQKPSTINLTFTVTYDFQPQPDGTYKEIVVNPKAVNFTQGETPGVPKLLAQGQLPFQASLADWITFEKEEIILRYPGHIEDVNFTINVPEFAEGGGKYAAILLDTDLTSTHLLDPVINPGIIRFNLRGALGPLVFMSVDGDINNTLIVEEIYTTNIKNKRTKFFFNPPVNIVVRYRNSGNVHAIPRGLIMVHRDRQLKHVYKTFELNEADRVILPNSVREFTYTWVDSFILTEHDEEQDKYYTTYNWDQLSKLRIGRYFATLQYMYRDVNQEDIINFTLSTMFWIFPWQLLLILLIILLLITMFIIRYILKKRKENSRREQLIFDNAPTPNKGLGRVIER